MNKLICLFSLIFLLNIAQANDNRVLIMGKVEQATFPMAKVMFRTSILDGSSVSYEVDLDENGAFIFLFPKEKPSLVTFFYGGEYTDFFVEAADRFSFSFQEGDLHGSILFSGEGNAAANNNFLHDFHRECGRVNPQKTIAIPPEVKIPYAIYDLLKVAPPDVFQRELGKLESKEINALERLSQKHAHSKLMRDYLAHYIHYRWNLYRLIYPDFCQSHFQIPANYFDFLSVVKIKNIAALDQLDYANFLDRYVAHLQIQKNKKLGIKTNYVDDLYEVIKANFEGKLRDFALARVLVVKTNSRNIEQLAPLFNDYFELSNEEEYRLAVVKAVNKHSKFSGLQKATNFELVSLDGTTVALSDFKGKIVYLSFWASWCKPCIQDIHDARANFDRLLENEQIVLLYVSIDSREERWRSSIEKNEIKGVHLWAGAKRGTPIEKAYEISSLPQHFLIGREGEFIPDFPHSNDLDFVNFLREKLK